MKTRKFDGHTSAACVNRHCQAFFRIEELAGWQESKALEAMETEAALAEARAERELHLEKIQRKMENKAKRWAKINKIQDTLNGDIGPRKNPSLT
jgi:uncharacterized protein YhaN